MVGQKKKYERTNNDLQNITQRERWEGGSSSPPK